MYWYTNDVQINFNHHNYLPKIRLLDSRPAFLTAWLTSSRVLNWSTIALTCRTPYIFNSHDWLLFVILLRSGYSLFFFDRPQHLWRMNTTATTTSTEVKSSMLSCGLFKERYFQYLKKKPCRFIHSNLDSGGMHSDYLAVTVHEKVQKSMYNIIILAQPPRGTWWSRPSLN